MPRCEDYPCCGHELGCCPETDPDTGEVLSMTCTCGAKVPLGSRFSICDACLNAPDPDDPAGDYYPDPGPGEDVEEDYGY